MRGIAALGVVGYHYTTMLNRFYGDPSPSYSVAWGHYGVNLFFVISGFVISSSCSNAITGPTFLVRRAARIYPAYLPAVLVSAILAATTSLPNWNFGVAEVAINLTMFQRMVLVPSIDGVYWTLAVELAFYLFVFLLIQARCWARPRRDCALLLWAVASLVYALLPTSSDPRWSTQVVGHTLAYGPLFIGGIAIREKWGTDRRTRAVSGATFAIAAAAFVIATPATEVAISAGCVALVWWTSRHPLRLLRLRPLVALGEASYVLYLIHNIPGAVILLALRPFVPVNFLGPALAAVAVLLSIWIHRHYEIPVSRWARTRLERLVNRGSGRTARRSPTDLPDATLGRRSV